MDGYGNYGIGNLCHIQKEVQYGVQSFCFTEMTSVMIACCNDGTRPVIFKIERIDVED